MIGRWRSDGELSDPDAAPTEPRCAPLRFDHDGGAWVPVEEGDPFMSELDAARACAADLRGRWMQVVRAAQLVRALCEHPEFEFEFDGIDDEMIRASVLALQTVIHACDVDFTHLVDHPGDDDSVRIADTVFRGDSETGFVRPANGDDEPSDAGTP